MAEESAEIVRRYFELIDRMLEQYWANPVPLAEFPPLERAFEQVHDDAAWTPPYLEHPLRGKQEWLTSLEDWFDAAENWRIHVDDVNDLGDGIVLVASRNQIRGKGSGLEVEQGIFTIVTVRQGLIVTIRDFPERDQALAAARAPEA